MVRTRVKEHKLVPKVLRWARERAGFAQHELAAKLNVPVEDVVEWESEGTIGTQQVRDLAHQTLSPYGSLFLSSPLDDSLPVADFRTVGNAAPRMPSPELYATLMAMLLRQDWFREEMEIEGAPPIDFVCSHEYKQSSPETVAQHMRDTFKLAYEWNIGKIAARAHECLFDSLENAGILTFISCFAGNNIHRPLGPAEFRGFALVDKRAPLIFVNGNDTRATQMFTLAHEAAHLFIGKSGISLCDVTIESQAVETFCSNAAACFLVPEDLFVHHWRSAPNDKKRVGEVANAFCVAKPVIAFRARELGYLTPEEHREFCAAPKKTARANTKRHSSSERNFWRAQKFRIGERFGDSVVRAVLAGEMQDREAWYLTDLNRKTFDELVEKRRLLV